MTTQSPADKAKTKEVYSLWVTYSNFSKSYLEMINKILNIIHDLSVLQDENGLPSFRVRISPEQFTSRGVSIADATQILDLLGTPELAVIWQEEKDSDGNFVVIIDSNSVRYSNLYSFGNVLGDELTKDLPNQASKNDLKVGLDKYIGFDGHDFWLRIVDGSPKVINFSPTRRRDTDTFVLFSAMVEILKEKPEPKKGTWVYASMSKQEITRMAGKLFKKTGFRERWVSDTKGNLMDVIPSDVLDSYIDLPSADRKTGLYRLGINLPE